MAHYSFLTTWALDAPLEEVWDAIHATERWPEWWPGVKVAEQIGPVRSDSGDGVGSMHRYIWRSRLPYDIEFRMRTTRVERPCLLEGEADGQLRGTGRWRLWTGVGTAVTYEWNVETTIPWMNAIAPIGRPVFRWSHDHVMRNGGHGLARLLGAELLVCD